MPNSTVIIYEWMNRTNQINSIIISSVLRIMARNLISLQFSDQFSSDTENLKVLRKW